MSLSREMMSKDDLLALVADLERGRPNLVPDPVTGRIGGFFITYTGRRFWPLDPRVEDVDIVDIARSLAFTNRWRGHIRFPYSVAQHSVHVSEKTPSPHKLAALLHDASEAYLGDMASPIKAFMPEYRAIEDRLQRMIYRRFGLEEVEPPEVKAIDTRICGDEAAVLFADRSGFKALPEPLGIEIKPIDPEVAFARFLRRYAFLTGCGTNAELAIQKFRDGAA